MNPLSTALPACFLCSISVAAIADVRLVSLSPSFDDTVGTSVPEMLIEFSGAVDPATATIDSVRIYSVGDAAPTPGPDDTRVAIATVTPEEGNSRLRITTQDPLPDGRYAWAIYGSSSERSGPGNGLYFYRGAANLDVEAFKILGDEFTIEAWTCFDDWSYYGSHTYGAVFDVGQSGRHVPGFWLSHVRDEVHFGFRLIDGTTAHTIALEALSKGEWRHLAGVSSAQGMTIYVNGAPATWMPDHFRPDSIADYIEVALSGYSRWAGAYDYVLGMFDEMRVWNVARTEAQINTTMHTPLAGTEDGLLLYHPLDQTTGDVLVDATGHGYTGARGGASREPSEAPLIEMSSIALFGADGIPVDVTGDSVPGGILVSTFIVDTTPPRVVSMDPDLIECDTVVAVPTLTIGFDDEMDAATLLAANADLIGSGGDGTFDDGNEVQVTLTDPQYDAVAGAATFFLDPPIPDDTYRFRLMDQVQSMVGAALDGEFPGLDGPTEPLPSGDGTPGGDFVIGFIVDSTQDCNGNGATDACEIVEGPAVPPLGAVRNATNGHYYSLAPAMTWAEAEALAVSLGGHLATIRNEVENQWLSDAFLALTSAERVFIGFSDLDVEGVWVWTSGEPLTYTNWAPGQPDDNSNEDIGELVLRAGSCCDVGTWNDRESDTVQPAIIEVIATNDCNDNGALDECDIADETSDDCNANGVPDECEPQEDCNTNGIQDICDVGSGASRDCNANGVPDECDIATGVGEDVNGNGMLDECELVVDRVKPCGRFFLFPAAPWPGDLTDAVRAFDRSANPKGVFLGGAVHVSAGAAFDRGGNLILSQPRQDVLFVMNRDGQLIQTIGGGGLDGAQGPAIDGKGHVAVGSYFTDSIKFFDLDGTYLGDLRHSGTEDPKGVAYDHSGNLFVASRNNGNGRVAVFDSEHNFVRYIGEGLLVPHPSALAFDKSENLYATMSSRIHKFSHEGALLDTFSHPELEPHGIALDEKERIFVTSRNAHEIFVFGTDGVLLDRLSVKMGPDPPSNLELFGIAFDVFPERDCNGNGNSDACDIEAATSDDCNANGVPDECELDGNDCNGNDVPDDCEPDCNENGLADDCDLDDNDCNENGIPDDCEFNGGVYPVPFGASESPLNGHFYLLTPSMSWPDAEAAAVSMGGHLATIRSAAENEWLVDTFVALTGDDGVFIGFNDIDTEGRWAWSSSEPVVFTSWGPGEPNNATGNEDWGLLVLRQASILSPGDWNDGRQSHEGIVEVVLSNDCNENGILDECDIADETSDDCNENGIPDECEPQADCNTNTVQDICDIFDGTSFDCNVTGVPDECELVDNDCNTNGVPDGCEDCNDNGLADECDIDADTSEDCNGNHLPDECEPDCNNNSVADECDISAHTSFDFDDNGVPDECQPDCNDNGFPDFLDIAFTYSLDCNTNAIPDECDVEDGTSTDCNTNDVPDECDVADGTSDDCNDDIVPDECEPDADDDGIPDQCDQKGDFDHDVDVDLDDYQVFWDCLFLSGPGDPPPFLDCLDAFDFDDDEDVDLRDLAAFAKTFAGTRQRGSSPVR